MYKSLVLIDKNDEGKFSTFVCDLVSVKYLNKCVYIYIYIYIILNISGLLFYLTYYIDGLIDSKANVASSFKRSNLITSRTRIITKAINNPLLERKIRNKRLKNEKKNRTHQFFFSQNFHWWSNWINHF